MVLFARRVAHFTEVVDVAAPGRATPASTPSPASCSSPPATTWSTSSTTPATRTNVVIDLSDSHIWDASTVAALDAIEPEVPTRKGKTVEIIGLNEASHGVARQAHRAAATGPTDRRSHGGQLQIGEVAERTGLSMRTMRHYEEDGLVAPSARSDGGFRLYTEDDIARLHAIRRMKPLGFTLEEMRELLDSLALLADAPPTPRTADGRAFVKTATPGRRSRAAP